MPEPALAPRGPRGAQDTFHTSAAWPRQAGP